MATAKVTINGTTILDLTDATAQNANIISPYTSYGADGAKRTGSIASKTSSDLTVSGATVTAPAGYYAADASKSVASGTAGTPTATKGTVSNHSISVTPSVTNTTGYITGGTKSGTAVTVSASELVSGSQTVTTNDTYDVTNLAEVVVNVSGGGGVDIPTFTVTYVNDAPSISCDWTFQECQVGGAHGYMDYGYGESAVCGVYTSDSTSITYVVYSDGVPSWGFTYNSDGTITPNSTAASLATLNATANGTYNAPAQKVYKTVEVNVSGSSKATQAVQGTTRTTSSTLTAIGTELLVEKTGVYDIYWSAFRSNTSSSYTYGTQLFINNVAYGSENTTWTNHQQNNHLTNVSLSANQTIRVRGRNSRGSSYYIYAPTLVIIEA